MTRHWILMPTLMFLILGLGSTAAFSQKPQGITAVVEFYLRSEYGLTLYKGSADLGRLDESNMWECRKTLDKHDYLIRIFKADNSTIRILVSASHANIDLPKASFLGILEIPTTEGPGSAYFDSTDPFLIVSVWTYPTERRLAEKTASKDRDVLPCPLKTKDDFTKGYSITLPYKFFENP